MKLLLVEDNREIVQALLGALGKSYSLDTTQHGKRGLAMAENEAYDAVILDLQLPDISGQEVCERLRQTHSDLPILILTGEGRIMTKIALLDLGADDYLTKPFSLGELKARLRAITRRRIQAQQRSKPYVTDDLTLDLERHEVKRAGKSISLRRKEFALLACLMQHAGTVVTRDALSSYAWQNSDDPWTNTIDVHIKYLRDKIDRPFNRPLIKTVHGIGYKLETSQAVAKT